MKHPEDRLSESPQYVVAVRTLCDFTAKRGDLDLRFTPSPSSQEGIAGHGLVAARRGSHYQPEVSLSGVYKTLLVRGRADGYDPHLNQVEEVKTYRGKLESIPDNHRQLHWAQVRLYGWLLCEKAGLSDIDLALVYFDVDHHTETLLREHCTAAELKAYFEEQCECFLAWGEQELAHRVGRNAALAALTFPHAQFRPGQRQLAAAVYRNAGAGKCLMAQAPTGIGKTLGTLFPLLKAVPGQSLDKVFYLSAKSSGRQLALDALDMIRSAASSPPLRVIELVARDKACEHPDKACHGDSCPLAQGFYDRLPQARAAAVARNAVLDRNALRTVALAHQICPYYLSQDLVRWCDVVVGDYNYYFDGNAMLHGMTVTNQWRVSVLVDEAHNMIERARQMYTAELDQSRFGMLRRSAPEVLRKALDRVQRAWNQLNKEQAGPYQASEMLPEKFLGALQKAIAAISEYRAEHPTLVDEALQAFHFDALHFSNLAEMFGAHSLFDVTQGEASGVAGAVGSRGVRSGLRGSRLCLRNVIPAPFLKPRFAAAQSVTLFSATLSPWNFYNDTLGLPEQTAWIDVESPFDAVQLSVQAVRDVSTRYRDRDLSLSPIVDLIARQYTREPGNYLAFLSSYDYLQKLASLFRERYSVIPMWEQSRRMDEAGQAGFLARFTPEGRGIGFAVLGGSFAEAIDLPGTRLIGAFIATLGLPQVNPVNEQKMRRMNAAFAAGYDYTYLYPGLQKVVQAAGRVIRTQEDRGIVYLIDDRFNRPEVRRLLPVWWRVELYDCKA